MSERFLQRWSRRKAESAAGSTPAVPPASTAARTIPEPITPAALPTLGEIAALGPDADYAPFVARGLDRTVHRAAMKQLFTDPRFNSMDGLDIYMDDYNRASPMSATMLAALSHVGSTLNPQPAPPEASVPASPALADEAVPEQPTASDPAEVGAGLPGEPHDADPTLESDAHARAGMPKMAALLADAASPLPEPVPAVHYRSQGRTLIIGGGDTALQWARQLQGQLGVTVLLTDRPARLPLESDFPVIAGCDVHLDGWLGAFDASWQPYGPRDPVQAQPMPIQAGSFDLIFDLSPTPLISRHQPPPGYFAPGADFSAQLRGAGELLQLVGEFDKPRYFQYKQRLCAHRRNGQTGCTACIDICSAQAIAADGDHVRVNPYLCAGCGACSTVCPSGALRYASPTVPHTGRRFKTVLSAYAAAGGTYACLLLHDAEHGTPLLRNLGRQAGNVHDARNVPDNVIPLELPQIASTGIDVWLGAIAYGATAVRLLCTGAEAPAYRAALTAQAAIAQAILDGLGLAYRIDVIDAGTAGALGATLQREPATAAALPAAKFALFDDKRNSLDFILAHLVEHAPVKNDAIALPAGAPFGNLVVDPARCTLCMACTGVCPSSALVAGDDQPRLRFIERNCIQCGLCARTCPEDALTLVPRLSLQPATKTPVTLHQAEAFCCIVCSKPIGTVKAIENLFLKLASHSAFAGHPDRLRMCGDCRVIDSMGAGARQTTSAPAAVAGVREMQRPRS